MGEAVLELPLQPHASALLMPASMCIFEGSCYALFKRVLDALHKWDLLALRLLIPFFYLCPQTHRLQRGTGSAHGAVFTALTGLNKGSLHPLPIPIFYAMESCH